MKVGRGGSLLSVCRFSVNCITFGCFVGFVSSDCAFFLFSGSLVIVLLFVFLLGEVAVFPGMSMFVFCYDCFFLRFVNKGQETMTVVFILYFFCFCCGKGQYISVVDLVITFLFREAKLLYLVTCLVPGSLLFREGAVICVFYFSVFLKVARLPCGTMGLLKGSLLKIIGRPVISTVAFCAGSSRNCLGPRDMGTSARALIDLFGESFVLLLVCFSSGLGPFSRLSGCLVGLCLISVLLCSVFSNDKILRILSACLTVYRVFVLNHIFMGFGDQCELLLFSVLSLCNFLRLLGSFDTCPCLCVPCGSVIGV